MSRGHSSFERVFPRSGTESAPVQPSGDAPSVHELFAMALREELPLPELAEALSRLHGIRMTVAAARLLSSVDAGSGRLSFSQFQRALQEDSAPLAEAGVPNVFVDQAKAIIADNCGSPLPPEDRRGDHNRPRTDISNEDFVKAGIFASRVQAQGPFRGSVLVPTNDASAANPLAQRVPAESADDELAGMYIGGELDRSGYEQYLSQIGLGLDLEVQKLIATHERAGVSFSALCRAVMAALDAMPRSKT
ncbi:CAMK2A [Symbiodinium microadriaticum]|nr:CAMK2A [Symbiodinium microadriaticum]